MVKRPALRYPGGKWRLAPWIIGHFPSQSITYVEPYGGAASVLLQKTPHKLETYNDLNSRVVNFFRVLRDNQNELIRKINLTPWAREEYNLSHELCDDPVEDARRFFVRAWMGISNGSPCRSGFRIDKHTDRYSLASHNVTTIDLHSVADRLKCVQIENIPAIDCMEKFDTDDTLHYVDPPYPFSTRKGVMYEVEMGDNENHSELSSVLHNLKGYVVLSGYQCELYSALYDTWQRFDKQSQTSGGSLRTESLWLSPKTAKALEMDRYPLFAHFT